MTENIIKIIKRRFDIFENLIKKSLSDIEILDKINLENEWFDWYKCSCVEQLKYLQINRFIPAKYIKKKYKMKNTIDKIRKDSMLILDKIVLPYPDINDIYTFYIMICDSILTYLLEKTNIDNDDYINILSTLFEGPYEYGNVKLSKNDIVIDAGANIGEFSALAGFKGCTVYAFEPMPYIIDKYLSKTAKMNPNIIIKQYALSDECKNLFFSQSGLTASSSMKKGRLKVEAINLDTFVYENKLKSVDYIKADIEGAERYMLIGAKGVLKEFAPKIAICTYHLQDAPKVLKELILDANPNYIIEERWKKMYAYVP